jgi:cell division protein FtsN
MAKPSKKNEKSHGRRGGSTFVGILIGLVLGLFIALGVAWYINKLPNPFKEKSQPPKAEAPKPAPVPAKEPPRVSAPPAADNNPPPATQDKATRTEEAAASAEKSAAEKKSTAPAKETFYLQTGSFQNAPEADGLKARLALLGLEAVVQQRTLPDKGVWHRVRVGPYSDVEELNRVRDVLKQNNIEAALVKVREAEK